MGAWGTGTFENDDALDWLHELERCGDDTAITRALNAAVDGCASYLEVPDCCRALAAAEVTAALAGNPTSLLPEEVTQWVGAHKGVDAVVLEKARRAVAAVFQRSELKELWEASDELEQWSAGVTDVLSRLRPDSV